MDKPKNNKSIIAFIFMVLSILSFFFIKNMIFIFIFAIISLIISLINLKSHNVLNYISLVGSSIIIVIMIVVFFVALKSVNGILSNARNNAMITAERALESKIRDKTSELVSNGDIKQGENIITQDQLAKYEINLPDKCEGYIIVNYDREYSSENKYDAYLKCEGYTT